MAEPKTIRATMGNAGDVAALFDAYRVFYEQASDVPAARAFIEARLRSDDSVIFLAVDEQERALGFVQLYPSFSSISLAIPA